MSQVTISQQRSPGPAKQQRPAHDYTRKLLASLPVPDPVEQAQRRQAFREQWGATAS